MKRRKDEGIYEKPNAARTPVSEEPRSGEKGWVIAPNKGWVEVTFYSTFGWMTDNELFDLRQSDPRIAP